MPVILQHFIHRTDLQNNTHVLYLFGDNEMRKGKGGQALEMRGEPNAIGIRTKRLPGVGEDAYWTDDTVHENCQMIDEDLGPVFMALSEDRLVVVPTRGLGTGLAELAKRAPKTLKYLEHAMEVLIGFDQRAF